MYTYTHTWYVCIYMHACIHTYIYTYIYTHKILPARCASPLQSWSHGASEGRCDRHCRHFGTRETGGAVPKVFRIGGHRGSGRSPEGSRAHEVCIVHEGHMVTLSSNGIRGSSFNRNEELPGSHASWGWAWGWSWARGRFGA